MAVKDEKSQPTVVINKLKFTYPGIDGHPRPGSAPLIDGFSLILNPGDRCLLVGSNGAVTLPLENLISCSKHLLYYYGRRRKPHSISSSSSMSYSAIDDGSRPISAPVQAVTGASLCCFTELYFRVMDLQTRKQTSTLFEFFFISSILSSFILEMFSWNLFPIPLSIFFSFYGY